MYERSTTPLTATAVQSKEHTFKMINDNPEKIRVSRPFILGLSIDIDNQMTMIRLYFKIDMFFEFAWLLQSVERLDP